MNNRILFELSPWFIIICLLAGLAYAVLLYRKKNPWGSVASWILGIMRFVLVSVIAFLLLGPLIRHIQNTIIKPSIVIALDNSRSVAETFPESEFNDLVIQLDELGRNLKGSLDDLTIKDLQGNDHERITDIAFDAPYTDLNRMIHDIRNDYEGKNLAGIVLVSDGIYNQGASPLYSSFGFPVYTVGVGDTTEKEDISLRSLNYNKIVYQGNKFLLQAEVYNKGYQGRSITAEVWNRGRMLDRKLVEIQSDNGLQVVEFELEAENNGMQRYELMLSPLESEFSLENNALNAFIEVVEGKQKILLLASAPHPDLKAIRGIIEKNDNYEIDMVLPGIGEKEAEKYDLVILHQLPDSKNTFNAELEQLEKDGTPVFYILGNITNINRFNSRNQSLTIKPMRSQRDNVFIALNPGFDLFSIDESFNSIAYELPPITVPFGEYALKGGSVPVIYQRIGRITVQKPLLIINKNAATREAVLTGEGLWKWRLNEYLLTNDFTGIDNLINKTIQFLSAKEDRRKFRTYPVRNENWDNEPVIFESEIYNDIYEKIYDQKIDLSITDEENNQYDYSYIISQANSQFRISGLSPGVYTYRARTNLNGTVQLNEGTFAVKQLLLEIVDLKADFNLLRELSRRTSGKFYTIGEINELTDNLQTSDARSLIYSADRYSAIINLKWIFFVIMALITLEWGVRKYLGGY